MEGAHHFLAVDCGATSCRAVLASFHGRYFSMEEVCRFPNGIFQLGGKYYWDIYSIYNNIVSCLCGLGRRGIHLDSIGIDSWGVDFGFVAADGSMLGNPRAYRDPYTDGVPEEVFRTIEREELYGYTGIQILNFNSIFQLYAQTREDFAPLKHSAHILFIPDLLSYMLTGKMVCEYTDASTSGMMDQKSRSFNTSLLERLGVRTDMLLPIVPSGTTVGVLSPGLARETGLGEVKVVAVAGHDTASAIAAVPAADGHFAYLSSGTWSLMGIEVPSPIITEESCRLNYTNEGGIEGTTRFLKNITGMWLLEKCREVWKKQGRDYSYEELKGMALQEKDFSGRVDPNDHAFDKPEDMTQAINRSIGSTLSDPQTVSCIYHSLADSYARTLDQLRSFAPFPIERLHVIGGGSANSLLNEWTARKCGITVVAGPSEATALGNIMLQAQAAGLAGDRWEMRRMFASTMELETYEPNL